MDKLTGFKRIVAAFDNSINGFSFLLKNEAALRQEAGLAALLSPFAFVISQSLLELFFLLFSLILVLVVEILNTAIEATIDRIGPEYHELSGLAKDLGSAAVLVSLLFCAGVWLSFLWRYLSALVLS